MFAPPSYFQRSHGHFAINNYLLVVIVFLLISITSTNCLSIVTTSPTISSGGRSGENFPFFARCAPFFLVVLVSTRFGCISMISPATKTVYYNFDYSPRRGFGFFNCASFTLTKLAVAGLSSKGLSSNKNYQKNSFVSTMSLLEASVSVRRYNCMSDEHRIEVDTRIDEIKYHHRVNDYEEICEMVTRYVEDCYKRQTIALYANRYNQASVIIPIMEMTSVINILQSDSYVDKAPK